MEISLYHIAMCVYVYASSTLVFKQKRLYADLNLCRLLPNVF